jgi:hypothetical protein
MSGRSAGRRVGLAVAVIVGTLSFAGAPARAATPSTGFHVLAPARLVDTRTAGVTMDGQGSGTGLRSALAQLTVTVAGRGGVPVDASRAALRITSIDVPAVADVYVHPCGAFVPDGIVLLRGVAGIVESQLAFPTLVGGSVCVTTTGPSHLLIDVEGYEDQGPGGAAYVAQPDQVLTDGLVAGPGGPTAINVTASGFAPVGSLAISGTITVRTRSPGFVTLYACNTQTPIQATAVTTPGSLEVTTAVVAPLSANGQVCVYTGGAQATVAFVAHGFWLVGGTPTADGPVTLGYERVTAPGLVATTPQRLFDTRGGYGRVDGDDAYDLDLSRLFNEGATDVVLNVTVTDPVAAGYVTAYPCDADLPTASNLNFVAGQTVPNLVTVSLGASGHVCFFASVATHLVTDLSGWYEPGGGSGFEPSDPTRLFDTRSGARPAGGSVFELMLDDRVPADATALVMNVTATEATAEGFVTVYPCAAGRPTASNLNVTAGLTAPNLVTVAVGADRRVCFFTSVPTHLLADLAGSYTTSSTVGYFGVVPERLVDTRVDPGRLIAAAGTTQITFGPATVGSPDIVVALVLNITVVGPKAAGFVTAYPCDVQRPNASNLNFVVDQVVPNLAVVAVDDGDRACFYAHQATHLLADLAGFFSELPVLVPVTNT